VAVFPRVRSYVSDPILFALERGRQVDPELLRRAITFRESRIHHADRLTSGRITPTAQALRGYIDEWAAEITALKTIKARLLNAPEK
jgi:hypothetical protein